MSNDTLYYRQEQVIVELVAQYRGKSPNISKLALENNVPYQRLRSRLNGTAKSTTAYQESLRVLRILSRQYIVSSL